MKLTNLIMGAHQFCVKSNLPSLEGRLETITVSAMVCHDYIHYILGLYLTEDHGRNEQIEDIVEAVEMAVFESVDYCDFLECMEDDFGSLVKYKRITKEMYDLIRLFN